MEKALLYKSVYNINCLFKEDAEIILQISDISSDLLNVKY